MRAQGAARGDRLGHRRCATTPRRSPASTNLLEILGACTGADPRALAGHHPSYGALKRDVADAVVAVLAPVQARYAELAGDPAEVDRVLDEGRRRAEAAARPRLEAAALAVGLMA